MAWGSAAILLQSTTKPGSIKVRANLLYPGDQRPLDGELLIETIPNTQKELYDANELQAMKQLNNNTNINSSNNTQLEDENRRLRKELNELKVKEVERQQSEFGVGIND